MDNDELDDPKTGDEFGKPLPDLDDAILGDGDLDDDTEPIIPDEDLELEDDLYSDTEDE